MLLLPSSPILYLPDSINPIRRRPRRRRIRLLSGTPLTTHIRMLRLPRGHLINALLLLRRISIPITIPLLARRRRRRTTIALRGPDPRRHPAGAVEGAATTATTAVGCAAYSVSSTCDGDGARKTDYHTLNMKRITAATTRPKRSQRPQLYQPLFGQ